MSELDIQRQIRDILDRLERLEKPDVGGVVVAFTPTYNGTTPGTTTYSTQEGQYIRFGDLVIAWGKLVWTNATGSGQVRLGGLPFTSAYDTAFAVRSVNVTFANGSIQGILQANQVVAQLFSPATNAAGTELTVEAAGSLWFVIVYLTA